MSDSSGVFSRVDGRGTVVAIGAVYVALAVAWPFGLAPAGESLGDALVMFVLVGGPGLGLVFGGLRLSRTDVRTDLYPTVAAWCLGAIAVLLIVLLLYELQPNDSLSNPVDSVLILTSLAAVAGLGIGVHDARSKTRARNAEEHTRKLERYETIVETVEDGIYVVGPDETFSMVNSSFTELVGYDEDELIGRHPPILYDEETKAEVERLRREILDGERTSATIEHPLQTSDSDTFPVETKFTLRRTADGYERIGVVRDVTDRKERERELEAQNERLDSFARSLAHELRNPVTVGQIYGQQLPDEADSEAVEHVRESFDRIEDTIDVLLVLAKGREAVDERTAVELAPVAREVWDGVGAPDATLDVAVERTLQTDETYVRHLLRNLFENAVEHGGGKVTVTVGELPTGFYVADDGTGFETDDPDTVFETGYTTAAGQGGMGLGLAFVSELADVYEWEYAARESDAGGARFEFRNVTEARPASEGSRERAE